MPSHQIGTYRIHHVDGILLSGEAKSLELRRTPHCCQMFFHTPLPVMNSGDHIIIALASECCDLYYTGIYPSVKEQLRKAAHFDGVLPCRNTYVAA